MAMAMAELPLHISGSLISHAGAGLQSKPEFGIGRTRFPANSSWRSGLSLNCKEVRSRTPCCMSVDLNVDGDSAKTESEPENRTPTLAELEFESPSSKRPEEKFAVLNTGKWECRSCGYVYDQSVGDSSYPVAAGTEFSKLPEDWRCPTCGAAKNYFNSKSIEVAGFAENQKFGLGTNSLTSGQKSILIYGSLLLFFMLFLSGYFLQ